MKYFFSLMIAFAIIFSSTSYSLDIKKYQIKSAIVEYKISGAQTGKETLYFDNYGFLEARYTESSMTMMGFTVETNTITISDKDWIYNIDMKEKKGTKMSNEMLKAMLDGLTQKDYEEFGRKMMQEMGGKKIGEETYMGKTCEVWTIESMNTKMWVYKLIPLKIEMTMFGTVTYETVKFEENVSIPKDKFIPPKDIPVEEVQMPEFEDDMEEEDGE
jgi:hypothetical protein